MTAEATRQAGEFLLERYHLTPDQLEKGLSEQNNKNAMTIKHLKSIQAAYVAHCFCRTICPDFQRYSDDQKSYRKEREAEQVANSRLESSRNSCFIKDGHKGSRLRQVGIKHPTER